MAMFYDFAWYHMLFQKRNEKLSLQETDFYDVTHNSDNWKWQ